MVEKLQFSLLNMGQMLSESTKEELLKHFQSLEAGQEVIVHGEGIEMITEAGITGGEVAAGAMIGMKVTGTGGGRETIDVEAGATVQVLITAEAGMMMDDGI